VVAPLHYYYPSLYNAGGKSRKADFFARGPVFGAKRAKKSAETLVSGQADKV
jgi:hypothetical protein